MRAGRHSGRTRAAGAGLAFLLGGPALAAPLVLGAPSASAATAQLDARPVALTRTVTRAHLEANGTTTKVDTRTVTLRVGQTRALRSRQPVEVSWQGAHPTSGVVGDPTSSSARLQEYPFVLLECRGVDSASAPAGLRLTPRSCWTRSAPERFQADYATGFPAWRLDRKASPAERQAVVGAPSPRPASCGRPNLAEHWLPFVAASGATYNQNLFSTCGELAPEAANVEGGGQPSNTTYGVTRPDGSGATKFTMWTAEDNASLGCTDTVPCALVAVPVMGISCDETAAALPATDRPPSSVLAEVKAACRATGNYAPGAPLQNDSGSADSVTGSLWWAASNWSQRITVPLSFAPLASACDVSGRSAGVDIYGSELLVQATSQWRPWFCLSSALQPFKHVEVGEPQARNLLQQGSVDAAFVSFPPSAGWGGAVANAPTALTGFSIGYTIDDAGQREYHHLKLDARLLAKLLTESYPAISDVQRSDAALANNPLNITHDPEFQALNPGLGSVLDKPSEAELFSLSSDSDVIRALTSYLQADPEARAFLDGTPDPWGMVVNPSYKGIVLPVESWPQKDTFEPTDYYAAQNPCLNYAPVPYLPLVSAPTARLANITLGLQFALANSQVDCHIVPGQDDGRGAKLVALGHQNPGYRFLIGVTSLGDAHRYAIDSAALQVRSSVLPSTRFSDAQGRVFAAPTDDSLRAAAALLRPDPASGAWELPAETIRTSSTGAYPGTMLVYTAVPTAGLKPAEAQALAGFLRFVAVKGQVAGFDNGTLPPGYLPLTATNHLAAQASYTARVAQAVSAQAGALPSLIGAPASLQPSASSTAGGGPASDGPVPSSGLPGQASASSVSPQAVPTGGSPLVARSPALPASATSYGVTPAGGPGLAGVLLPLLVSAGLLGLLASLVVRRLPVAGGRP